MSWAEAADVIDSWIGADAPTDAAKVDVWVGRAERLIRREFPSIQDRIDGNETDLAENVKDVIVSMVTRVFRNPHGYRSMSGQQTSGPFSGNDTITFGGDNPGALELLPSERALLGAGGSNGNAFSVDLLVGHEGSFRGPQYWMALGRQSE